MMRNEPSDYLSAYSAICVDVPAPLGDRDSLKVFVDLVGLGGKAYQNTGSSSGNVVKPAGPQKDACLILLEQYAKEHKARPNPFPYSLQTLSYPQQRSAIYNAHNGKGSPDMISGALALVGWNYIKTKTVTAKAELQTKLQAYLAAYIGVDCSGFVGNAINDLLSSGAKSPDWLSSRDMGHFLPNKQRTRTSAATVDVGDVAVWVWDPTDWQGLSSGESPYKGPRHILLVDDVQMRDPENNTVVVRTAESHGTAGLYVEERFTLVFDGHKGMFGPMFKMYRPQTSKARTDVNGRYVYVAPSSEVG